LNFIFGIVCLFVCVCAFSLRRESPDMILGDKPLISEVVLSQLQKCMIHTGVHEESEDKICHFYGGLRTKIQDIVDYKEYNTVNYLFQLAMLAEKELQG
jgi:hypothetical protein